MKRVKVSLSEIMEDDNHPLMKRWASILEPELEKIIKESERLGMSIAEAEAKGLKVNIPDPKFKF